MKWRHTPLHVDSSQYGTALQRLGRKLSLGSGINSGGGAHNHTTTAASLWHRNASRFLPLVAGVAVLGTTLLLGSYLWNLVSRKNKDREKLAPFTDLYPRASHKPNTVVALREFTKPAPSLSPKVSSAGNGNNNYSESDHKEQQQRAAVFDTLVFDAEQNYAQILAEARSHAAATQKSPVLKSPISNNGNSNSKQTLQQPQPQLHRWLSRSSSARGFNSFLDGGGGGGGEATVAAAALQLQQESRFKASKSWKKLLFWKRSKKSNQFEYNVNGAVHSSCTTPLHYMFKSSRTRATVAPTTPPRATKKKPQPKRSSSGPLYNDGTPYTPNRNVSGPLSGQSTPSREGLFESPYVPLKRPSSTPKLSSAPLYVS